MHGTYIICARYYLLGISGWQRRLQYGTINNAVGVGKLYLRDGIRKVFIRVVGVRHYLG